MLQRAEHELDPIPFGVEAARTYGRVTAGVVAAGRKPRSQVADLMIAATAIAEGLPLFTTNSADFDELGGFGHDPTLGQGCCALRTTSAYVRNRDTACLPGIGPGD